MARVFKGRNFKYSDVLGVTLGANPSYVWHCLLWSPDIVKKGICWRVGNGSKISAKYELWILGIPSYKNRHNTIPDDKMMVADFINTTGTWNESKLRQYFHNIEAEAICAISLNRKGFVDVRCWMGNVNVCKAWKNTAYWRHLRLFRNANFLDCMLALSKALLRNELEVYVMMTWAIWGEVFKWSHDDNKERKEINMCWYIAWLENYRLANVACRSSLGHGTCSITKNWLPSEPNFVRLDVDAGMDLKTNKGSLGAVVRNSSGMVVEAKAGLMRHRGSVKGMKLEAIRFGLLQSGTWGGRQTKQLTALRREHCYWNVISNGYKGLSTLV
ncbi:uncharacterized protein [Henckelia pumila]|uniref:uncharacterized protein n=1 Tax=Henckelia pumila TaxID=405737 RepID=UPI003C6E99A4